MKRVHFQKIIFSDEAPRKRVHSKQPGSTSDCDVQERAVEETERQGGVGHSGSQSLEENMFKEARSCNAVTPCSRAQLAEYILALGECRSLVTLIKAS